MIQKLLIYLFKVYKQILIYMKFLSGFIHAKLLFFLNGVEHKNFKVIGSFIINVSQGGKVIIGNNFSMRGFVRYSNTGDSPTKMMIGRNARLLIGDNVGITSTVIVCHNHITIGNNVKIGGGSLIFDTNFHSTDSSVRATKDDLQNVITSPVRIEDNVFIGTRCIICKGVTIGANSIIAAGSVVVKSIPGNEVWGGNPAKFLKKYN
jgi:acetyltransferase-like isoleucine patch superfamily enzyme